MSRIGMRGAPTWDSSKEDEWSGFSTNFESYVELSNGGELVSILLDLMNPNPQDVSPSSALISTGDEEDGQEILTPEARVRALSPAFRKLDLQLYHVMELKIKGPTHQNILHCTKSCVHAMDLLYSEYGATNILRKTALISKLLNLMYDGNQVKFKNSALTLIPEGLKANTTIQDILIQCLLNSFNGEKFQGFKLMIAKQLDDETDSNPYVVLTEICNCIEQSEGDKANSATSRYTHIDKSSTQGGSKSCHRCGRSNHSQDSCIANSDVGANSDVSTKSTESN